MVYGSAVPEGDDKWSKLLEELYFERMLKTTFTSEIYGFRRLFSDLNKLRVVPSNTFAATGDSNNPQNLPSLPVPPLEKTLEKYLYTVRPHLNDQEFSNTCNIVKEFSRSNGQGEVLQNLLEKRAKEKLNWLADWWLQSAYLDYRSTVVVWSSPGLVYPLQKFKGVEEQLQFAAKMIKAAVDYKIIVDKNEIPLDKSGKDPLDMQQYKKIFGTCRIPGLKRDSQSFNDSRHIIVMYKNQPFYVSLWDDKGYLLEEHCILKQLKTVVGCAIQSSVPIGILTSEHRDSWGEAYNELIRDSKNSENLKKIEQSLFVVCLDEAVNIWNCKEKWERQTLAGQQTIHGGGSKCNGSNRWFDKTLQLIIGEDGINGLSYEHSPAEGVPIALMTNFVMKRLEQNSPTTTSTSSTTVETPLRLDFNITPKIETAVAKAKEHLDQLVGDLELNCFTFDNYGKDFIKKQKLSPDSYIQMAMQFAFYRLHKIPGAHYESAATRKYVHGRTETIRSCSNESIAFAKSMLDPNCSHQDKVTALHNAVNAHKKYTIDAMNGYGVDRHLLGLKLIAIESGKPVPDLFKDQGFIKSSQMRISTSQVATDCEGFMCYGPLVTNGYATCYNPRKDDMVFALSAFRSDSETSCLKYRKALELSLLDMKEMLEQATKSKL